MVSRSTALECIALILEKQTDMTSSWDSIDPEYIEMLDDMKLELMEVGYD